LAFCLFSKYAGGYTKHKDGRLEFKKNFTFCDYAKRVIGGFLVCCAIVAGGVLVGLGWIQGIGLILTQDFVMMNFAGAFGALSLALQILVLALIAIDSFLNKTRLFTRNCDKEPGFVKMWVKSKKEKYCPIVTTKK